MQRLSAFDDKESRIAKLSDVDASSLTWEELTALVFQGAIFGKGREDGRWLGQSRCASLARAGGAQRMRERDSA